MFKKKTFDVEIFYMLFKNFLYWHFHEMSQNFLFTKFFNDRKEKWLNVKYFGLWLLLFILLSNFELLNLAAGVKKCEDSYSTCKLKLDPKASIFTFKKAPKKAPEIPFPALLKTAPISLSCRLHANGKKIYEWDRKRKKKCAQDKRIPRSLHVMSWVY